MRECCKASTAKEILDPRRIVRFPCASVLFRSGRSTFRWRCHERASTSALALAVDRFPCGSAWQRERQDRVLRKVRGDDLEARLAQARHRSAARADRGALGKHRGRSQRGRDPPTVRCGPRAAGTTPPRGRRRSRFRHPLVRSQGTSSPTMSYSLSLRPRAMAEITDAERRDLFEVLDDRHGNRATIACSFRLARHRRRSDPSVSSALAAATTSRRVSGPHHCTTSVDGGARALVQRHRRRLQSESVLRGERSASGVCGTVSTAAVDTDPAAMSDISASRSNDVGGGPSFSTSILHCKKLVTPPGRRWLVQRVRRTLAVRCSSPE